MDKRPSVSVNVTVAQPQATSRVVNQISNAVNAPASTSSFLTTSQQSSRVNAPCVIPLSPEIALALQALTKGQCQTPVSRVDNRKHPL